MDCHLKQIRCWLQVFVVLGAGLCCGPVAVAEQDSGRQWIVKSVYQDAITGKTLPAIFWEFNEKAGLPEPIVEVRDQSGKTEFRQALFFNSDHSLIRVDSFRRIRNREIKTSRSFNPNMPVLQEDSIIPSNWINAPLPWNGEPVKFSITKNVGNQASFAMDIRLTGQKIDAQQALEQQMIPQEIPGRIASGQLLLVKIEKLDQEGKAQEILRQLWSSNHSFWLYEATAARKSWCVID